MLESTKGIEMKLHLWQSEEVRCTTYRVIPP